MAGKAEAAGERVEGASREAVVQVDRLGAFFLATGGEAFAMAGKAEAAGERVEGSANEAVAKVNALGNAFGKTGKRAGGMGTKIATMRRRLGMHLGGFAGALGLTGGAFAVAGALKRVASIETRMERLGIQSNRSTGEMEALRSKISEVANAPDIRVDPSQLTAAVEAIVEKTGDLDFARRNLELIAETIQGTGGTGDAIGRLAVEFRKLGITDDAELGETINLLTAQGKTGSFTMANFAAQGERLVSSFAAMGYRGPEAARQLGAFIQMVQDSVPGADRAATAYEAFFNTLSDADKLKKIENEFGVLVRLDPGPGELVGKFRAPELIIKDLIDAVDGDIVRLSEIFDQEARRAINAFLGEGAFEKYQERLGVQVTGDEMAIDAARIAKTTEAQAQDIRTSVEDKLAEYLTGPLRDTMTTIVAFKEELVGVAATAATLGIAAKGATSAFRGITRSRRGVRGGTGGGGGRLGDAFRTPAAPVVADTGGGQKKGRRGGRPAGIGPRVTTMRVGTLHAARLGGAFGKGRGGGAAVVAGGAEKKPRGRLGDAFARGARGSGPGRVAGVGAAAGGVMAAYDLATAILAGEEISAEDIAGAVGAIAGGAGGAAVGSFAGPVGTVGGGIAGSVAGEALGREAVEWFGETLERIESLPDAEHVNRAEMLREMRVVAQARDVEPAPEVLRERGRAGGRGTYGRSVSIQVGDINVNAPDADAEEVAEKVMVKLERRIADESRLLEDHVRADPSYEVEY